MDINRLKLESAICSLNNMMKKGTFYISDINDIAKMMGITPDATAMSILRPLHCVPFEQMTPYLREQVPELIKQALGGDPIYEFEYTLTHETKTEVFDQASVTVPSTPVVNQESPSSKSKKFLPWR